MKNKLLKMLYCLIFHGVHLPLHRASSPTHNFDRDKNFIENTIYYQLFFIPLIKNYNKTIKLSDH